MDRFGLRVIVRGLDNPKERLKAYKQVQAYLSAPHQIVAEYASGTTSIKEELEATRARLSQVKLPNRVANKAIEIIQKLGIDSLRAEITWFEAARAYAAASGRNTVKLADLHAVAPMALRLRRSKFIDQYFAEQQGEEEELQTLVKPFKRKRRTKK